MMKTGEWTAWFGDTASWDEASTPADAYKERLAQQNLEGDCEQIAMEVQSAYLSNEDQHAYLGKGKSKGYGKGKKGMSKGMKGKGYGKSKGYGKGKGNNYAKPGDLSLEDRRKKFQELKAKTKCQACGRVGHYWAGDNACPKRKQTANLATSLATPKVVEPQALRIDFVKFRP